MEWAYTPRACMGLAVKYVKYFTKYITHYGQKCNRQPELFMHTHTLINCQKCIPWHQNLHRKYDKMLNASTLELLVVARIKDTVLLWADSCMPQQSRGLRQPSNICMHTRQCSHYQTWLEKVTTHTVNMFLQFPPSAGAHLPEITSWSCFSSTINTSALLGLHDRKTGSIMDRHWVLPET